MSPQPNVAKHIHQQATHASADVCDLATASCGVGVLRSHESERSPHQERAPIDEIGPHSELIKKLGGVVEVCRAALDEQPRSAAEQRLKDARNRVYDRLERKTGETDLPKDARVVDLNDVLAGQAHSGPIKNFKTFFERAGILPGKTSYMRFSDGSVSAVRRRVLDSKGAAHEVIWVETCAAVGHLHSLEFSGRGARLVQPVWHGVRGFFYIPSRIAVVPMIEKRKDRPLLEWRDEALVTLATAVHELQHGQGGCEYEARVAADAYLYRSGVSPTPGEPEDRIKSICLNGYDGRDYSEAVGAGMRDLRVSALVVPARMSDVLDESVRCPIVASSSVAAYAHPFGRDDGHAAEIATYGLALKAGGTRNARRILVRQEGALGTRHRWLGEPLPDRIMRITSPTENRDIRTLVAEAISAYVADESVLIAEYQSEDITAHEISSFADELVDSFKPGHVHAAVQRYVAQRGGAVVIPHPHGDIWINSVPEGVALRMDDLIIVYLSSPKHSGGALEVRLKENDSYKTVAKQIRAFVRDYKRIDALLAQRSPQRVWGSAAVRGIGARARFLFPAASLQSRRGVSKHLGAEGEAQNED